MGRGSPGATTTRAVSEGGPSPEPPREQPSQAWASELRGDVRGLAALPVAVAMTATETNPGWVQGGHTLAPSAGRGGNPEPRVGADGEDRGEVH